jgi:ankyrin repeat protein
MELILKVKSPLNQRWIDVELVSGCSWQAVTTAIATQLDLLSREEIKSLQLVDANGEYLSAKINNGAKFWSLIGNTSNDEDIFCELQLDAELRSKLAEAVAIEKFRSQAAQFYFALASDPEKIAVVHVQNNCSWEELQKFVAAEFQGVSPRWIHHYILIDSEGDELSDNLNTAAKFWKFGSTYNRDSGNIFTIHFDEKAIAETERLEKEKEYRERSRRIRVKYGKIEDLYVPKLCSWEEIVQRTGELFQVAPDCVSGFYYVDDAGEKLSSSLNNAVKFWKFAEDYDFEDGTYFEMVFNADVQSKKQKEKVESASGARSFAVRRRGAPGGRMEVRLTPECSWDDITSAIGRSLDTPGEIIDELIWMDQDDDELAPAINNGAKFWKIASKYRDQEGQYFMVVESEAKLAELERKKQEEEMKASARDLTFALQADGAQRTVLSLSQQYMTWTGLLDELVAAFPPLGVDWISHLLLILGTEIASPEIRDATTLWQCYERCAKLAARTGDNTNAISFVVVEHKAFRSAYEQRLQQEREEQERLAAEERLRELKAVSKEILVEIADMGDAPSVVYVPYSCKDWYDLLRIVAQTCPAVEPDWISYIILVDHVGEELSVAITDISKFWKLCGDEYTVRSNYRFVAHLDPVKIAEARSIRQYERFRKTAVQFHVSFKALGTVSTADVLVQPNSDWFTIMAAISRALNGQVGESTVDYIKLKDGSGDELSPAIKSAEKFWVVYKTYSAVEGMTFEVYDFESLSRLEQEKQMSEKLAGRTLCYFRVDQISVVSVPRTTFEVLVPSKAPWTSICEAVEAAIPSVPAVAITYFVLVDADGDELSTSIDTAGKFWKIADSYNLSEGFVFLVSVNEERLLQYIKEEETKKFRATAASFRVYVLKEDRSRGTETEVFVPHDCSWESIIIAVVSALHGDVTSVTIKSMTLVDRDGDSLSPPVSGDSKFWKIFNKNKKSDKVLLFAVQLGIVEVLLGPKSSPKVEESEDVWVIKPPKQDVSQLLVERKHTLDAAESAAVSSSLLEDACLKGDMTYAVELINAGADVNSVNEAGTQPIHFASVVGDVDLVRLLVAAGANVNAVNREGATPMHFACEQGHDDLVIYFLSLNASLSVENANGVTPLDYLCSQGKDNLILSIIKKKPDFEFNLLLRLAAEHGLENVVITILRGHLAPVDTEDEEQRTPMHFACLNGSVEVARLLVNMGASVRAKDSESMTPLLYACNSGSLKLVKYLVANGGRSLLDDVDNAGNTALIIASRRGHLDLCQWLVKVGLDYNKVSAKGVNAAASAEEAGFSKVEKWLRQYASRAASREMDRQANMTQLSKFISAGSLTDVRRVIENGVFVNGAMEHGNTPFHFACANGILDICKLLVDNGSDMNVINAWGWSPLITASYFGYFDIVKWILDCGVEWRNVTNGNYPIHCAAIMGRTSIVQHFLDLGCNISLQNSAGLSLLHEAVLGNNLECARALVERGIDRNISQPGTGVCPLHISCYMGHLVITQWLVYSGAVMDCPDMRGRTPFLYAVMSGELGVMDWLLEKGVNIHVRTDNQDTAVHIAAQRGLIPVLQWLIDHGADINAINGDKRTPFQVALFTCQKSVTNFLAAHFAHSNVVQPEEVAYQVALEVYRTTSESHFKPACFALEEMMRRVEPMFKLPGGAVPLHFACAAAHIGIVKYLLLRGCPVDIATSIGRTPLHYAAMKGHIEVARILLEAGANPMLKDSAGRTPMDYAEHFSQRDFADLMKSRLESAQSGFMLFACLPVGPSETSTLNDDVEETTSRSDSKLAAVDGAEVPIEADWADIPAERYKDLISYIEKLNPGFTTRDQASGNSAVADSGGSALHTACTTGNLQMVQSLAGASTDLNVKNSIGLTPLYIACDNQFADIGIFLVKKNADLGAVCAPGDTPLHRICARGMVSLLEQLVNLPATAGIRVHFDVKTTSEETLLHVTAKAGFIAIANIICKQANLMNARDSAGKTALHYVCETKNLEMAEFLISHGAFLNVRDSKGNSPLFIAARFGDLEMCKLLAKNGASLIVEDDSGNSLLHVACNRGDAPLIAWLLRSGADKSAKNLAQKTPLDVLQEAGFKNSPAAEAFVGLG